MKYTKAYKMDGYRIGYQTDKGKLYIPLQSYKPYIVVFKNGKKIESTNLVNLKKELS